MYDGATALAEASLMASRMRGIRRILISRSTNPSFQKVLKTYLQYNHDIEVSQIPFNTSTGQIDLEELENMTGSDSAIFVQQPNFFGVVEPMEEIARIASRGGFWGIVISEAVSLGLLKNPGTYDPDIVLGEAQSFGNPPGAGGPLLGFLCVNKKHVRRIPGRIVGLTRDSEGRQAFCLTLSTREQHIRREKATSNICTNQGLCALRAALYLSAMGPQGLKQVASQCASGARHLMKSLQEKGITPVFNAPVFNEFVIRMDDKKRVSLQERGIIAGIPIGDFYPEIEDGLLMSVTEMNTKEDCRCLIENL
jgi:glycine dehydrogenase subunit 1